MSFELSYKQIWKLLFEMLDGGCWWHMFNSIQCLQCQTNTKGVPVNFSLKNFFFLFFFNFSTVSCQLLFVYVLGSKITNKWNSIMFIKHLNIITFFFLLFFLLFSLLLHPYIHHIQFTVHSSQFTHILSVFSQNSIPLFPNVHIIWTICESV